jgi:D-beta-D-heptose 7-phosphate kinase/D-beta-D-heptose 1-phosphate adenosyltransferase
MTPNLSALLQRVAGRRVLVVGDVILDEYVDGDASRISPEAPVPVLRFQGRRAVLGGAANTAANVASLGGRATLVGLVGDDAAGAEVARLCAEADVTLAPLSDGRATTRKTRIISRQQQMLRIDHEDTHAVDASAEAQLLAVVSERVGEADILVVSDYAKGLLTRAAFDAIRTRAAAARRSVVVDPRPRHASYYQGVDYLTPNWKEALELLGERECDPSADAIERIGRQVRDRFTAGVLLTLGPRGMSFFPRDGAEPIHVPAQAREVFDVSGAGDTVVAAFALALAAEAPHEDAVWLANRAAAAVVGKRGTATVTPAELLGNSSPSAGAEGGPQTQASQEPEG